MHLSRSSWLILAALTAACSKPREENTTNNAPATSAVVAAPSAAEPAAPPRLIEQDADHVGGVIARAPGTDGVYIADEDHGNLRFIADTSPLLDPSIKPASATPQEVPEVATSAKATSSYPSASAPATSASAISIAKSAVPEVKPPASAVPDGATEVTQQVLALGGAPANLIAIRDGALVTIRDPGKLVRIRKDADGNLAVAHEIALAADAWGLALNQAGTRALVTSAWTNTVTLLEITDAGFKKCGEVAVAREPRGVAFASDEIAYVNHLVGNEITRLEIQSTCDGKGIGEAKALVVAPSPLRSPVGKTLPASLGYALALSPDKRRLFVPRHALGARSHSSWFGAPTVDTLLLPDEKLAAPMHEESGPKYTLPDSANSWDIEYGSEPVESWTAFVQPRDIRYRNATQTVLVVSEGADRLVELDALALDPSQAIVALHELSDWFRRKLDETLPDGFQPVDVPVRDPYVNPSDSNPSGNKSCAAPQGVVLDAKESAAFIYCRASSTLVRMRLNAAIGKRDGLKTFGLSWAKLDKDAGGKENLNLGRRLFYSSTMAEGMGCAGCHPEGRDDGHVWIEVKRKFGHKTEARFIGGHFINGSPEKADGVPRRTPMLVSRVFPVGPYGWRGESETLEKRIMAGTQLHAGEHPPSVPEYYANSLGIFLRKGLVKPPIAKKELSDEEKKGKAIFEDSKAACSVCHEPTRYFSNFTAMKLAALPTLPGFEEENDALFKTPPLLYVSHHGSMLHDGSAKSLEDLIEKNGTRMGSTAHLSADERKALVAYLKTL